MGRFNSRRGNTPRRDDTNYDDERELIRPAAWKHFKQAFGDQFDIGWLAHRIEEASSREYVDRSGFRLHVTPRMYLAAAMLHLVRASARERTKILRAYDEWRETRLERNRSEKASRKRPGRSRG